LSVLDRHLLKQTVVPAAAALALLFQLMIALQLLRRVDVLLGGAVRPRDVLELLWDLTPHYIVLVMPIAVLLGVLVGFGQLAEDRELDALASAGVSHFRLLAAPAALAAAATLIVFGLTLGPESRGLVRVRKKFDEILKLGVQKGVRPGIFYDEVNGLTLFAEDVEPATGAWRHVMVNDERDRRAPLLLLAERGQVQASSGDEALVLDLGSGQAHRELSSGNDYTALGFSQASLVIAVEDSLLRKNTLRSYDDEKSLPELWRETRGGGADDQALQTRVALHRRIGLILAVLALVWLGVPLAVFPAAVLGARARGYLFAAIAIVGYFVLLRLGTTLGMGREVPPWVSGQVANATFAVLGAFVWLRLRSRA
jgi:lipopolysaccharide export system permease protein